MRRRPLVVALSALLALCVGGRLWAADADGDGLDDAWEGAFFGNLKQGAGDDPDGDGLSNAVELAGNTHPLKADSDGDGLPDGVEDTNKNGKVDTANGKPLETDPLNPDSDGDQLTDGTEDGNKNGKWDKAAGETDPLDADSDKDGLSDFQEKQVTKTNPNSTDTDNGFSDDGVEVLIDNTDPTKPEDDKQDSDKDGLPDWIEVTKWSSDRFKTDSDGDGLPDGLEDANANGVWDKAAGETHPMLADSDGDGLKDGQEDKNADGKRQKLDGETDPNNADSDFEGLKDGDEVTKFGTDPLLADTDWDSLSDFEEVVKFKTSALKIDTDGGGVLDPVEVTDTTNPNAAADDKGKDSDGDGLSDGYELKVTKTSPLDKDTDGDGLSDAEERFPLNDHLTTDPLDADTDDDGRLDGSEGGISVDGDPKNVKNGTSPVLFDTDGDKLGDGQEVGLAKPQVSAKQPAATKAPPYAADADPASKTDPFKFDSDGDSLLDGDEDANQNGKWEPALGETDPNKADTDGDGMDDAWETKYASGPGQGPPLKPLDPSDAVLDNDGDGLSNLQEYQVKKLDEAGAPVANPSNPRAKDSDGDGLSDKTEVLGKYKGNAPFAGSDPNVADTDEDGLGDGVEDKNGNGVTEPSEPNPKVADTDGDGLKDGAEDKNQDGKWDKASGETDPANPDSDGEGLLDGLEVNLFGTNPLSADTDGDLLPDGIEVGKKGDADPKSTTDPTKADTDKDGLSDGSEDANKNGKVDGKETNPAVADTDGDGLGDGLEQGKAGDADPKTTTDPLKKDSDGDGLFDGTEDKNGNGVLDGGETDPNKKDTDGGGTPDGTEVLSDGTNPLEPADDLSGDFDGDGVKNGAEVKLGLDPKNPDSDGDTISDGQETNSGKAVDSDGDGVLDALDLDSDGDSWADAEEAGDGDWKTPAVDSNGDGLADFRSLDADGDELPDSQEKALGTDRRKADTDGDDLGDGLEVQKGCNPLDRDSDDDAVADGSELLTDGDGDGLIAALDPDSDNDGLFDGTELGRTLTTLDPDTDLAARAFIPDVDNAAQTNPHEADTDGDGLRDGAEDVNHNGRVDSGENDPNAPASAELKPDADKDGMPNAEEAFLGSDPDDADSDDDGVLDGQEWNLGHDTDRDGACNVADPDSDDDGLPDGLERGRTQPNAATWLQVGNFRADVDTANPLPSALLRDSDGDGQRDGIEDWNANGRLDPGEGDPTDAASLADGLTDTDGDGMPDVEEQRCRGDVLDPDSDDDGVADGAEADACWDGDRDGLAGLLDPDSDDDAVGDGTELGVTATVAGNLLKFAGHFRADLQPQSTSFPRAPDSDGDGQRDGWEDANHNGQVDAGEGDPMADDSLAALPDGDGDGLNDTEEATLGSNPADADSDDDGVRDGDEANLAFDLDLDGVASLLDFDADGDQLYDGTESARTAADIDPGATDVPGGVFKPDLDPASRTWASVADSDHGGQPDGAEDFSRDGQLDKGETNPLDPLDDGAVSDDMDGDGLPNTVELKVGTDPGNVDSDGDGIWDPTELAQVVSPSNVDGDGVIDALDLDSDNDGVPDKDEARLDQTTSLPLPVDSDGDGVFDFRQIDSDGDTLTDGDEVLKYATDPTQPDTDFGGLRDDIEVLLTLTNPLDPRDDAEVKEAGKYVRGTTPWSACTSSRTGGAGGLGLLGLAAACLWLRRRRSAAVAAVLWLSAVPALAPRTAVALTPPDVTGARPSVDGLGTLSLDSARELDLGGMAAWSQLQWAWRPLVIGSASEVTRPLVNWRLQGDIGAAWRPWSHLTLGLTVPVAMAQAGSMPSLYPQVNGRPLPVPAASLGDIVLTGKWLLRADRVRHWGVALLLPISLPTGNPDAYAGRPGPTATPTVAASTQIGPWRMTGNAGVRLQSESRTFGIRDTSAIRLGVGGSLNVAILHGDWRRWWRPERWWLDAALVYEMPATPGLWRYTFQHRLELAAAVNLELDNEWFLFAGSTMGLTPGFGVPAVRPLVGVRWGEQPAVLP